jgi:hypothetical protein
VLPIPAWTARIAWQGSRASREQSVRRMMYSTNPYLLAMPFLGLSQQYSCVYNCPTNNTSLLKKSLLSLQGNA